MEKEQILKIFKDSEALLDGHFLLTSGLHSPNYFQCAKVLQYPHYAEQLCQIIADHHKDTEIDCVISPAIGGIVAGQEVARLLGVKHVFAERQNDTMTLRRGFEIKPGEKVLAVEDVVTTGGSVKEVISLAQELEANVVGVAFIVDRSNGKTVFDIPQFSVLQMEVITHQPENCPLCKQGLEAVKPGSRNIK